MHAHCAVYNDVSLYSRVQLVCLSASADRLRVNTTKTIHFGRLHIFMTSHFGTPQVISHLGRQGAQFGPPRWGRKMAFYAPLF